VAHRKRSDVHREHWDLCSSEKQKTCIGVETAVGEQGR